MALAREVFAAAGTNVRIFENPFQLAAGFAAEPAGAVILDIERLSHGVPELVESLRGQSAAVGIVVLFTAEQRDVAGAALCRGADLLLLKPASCAEIVAAVTKAAQQSAGGAEGIASAVGAGMEPDALMRFALGVAHEVNNPLATISGWLQMLIADSAGDANLAERLKSINEEADRIAEVVRQLLTVAQQTPPHAEKVHLGRLLDELKRFHNPTGEADGVAIETEIASGLSPVRGDSAQIRLACDTLFAEIRASLNGYGSVHVACKEVDECVEITFHDDGPALTPAQMKHIFDPFQFGRNANGTGLGLCLAQSIIRSHGGTLVVNSAENKGTDYVIRLPAVKL